MAAREVFMSVKGNVMLNVGSTSTGSVRTKAMSIGKLSDEESAYDPDKFLAISNALRNLLALSVYYTQSVKTYQVTN